MNKTNRLALIKKLYNSRNLEGVVTASKSEIQEEVSLVIDHEDKGELEQDENSINIPSKELMSQIDQSKEHREKESDSILTPSERKHLAMEIKKNLVVVD